MKATDFEYRHQLLLHEVILGAATLTYLVDRDDIIWRFIKMSPAARALERSLFAVATLLFGVSAWLCTHARAHRHPGRLFWLGEYVYAFALASLVPFAGSLILIIGEGIRIVRLLGRGVESAELEGPERPGWRSALRRESIKWGLFVTMIVFTITLRDRVAEILIGASVVFWMLLNLRLSTVWSGLGLCIANRRA
jgi:hypothetical protein